MSLREITKDLHHEAETTKFAKLLLSGKITREDYANYLYQLILIYNVIELGNRVEGNFQNLPGLERTHVIYQDFIEIAGVDHDYKWLPGTLEYYNYLLELVRDPVQRPRIKAHLYCRHMGDLNGGQIIKKQVSHISKGRFYDFKNPDDLKVAIRSELTDELRDEARVAFEFAIKMMRELYNGE
jgi:heme oxygenase (biliverdin-producing, ferredoxin)